MNKCLILLATYNGEKFLKEQLDSLLIQKNVICDICITDDGSTDNTLDIIQEYCNKYSNIYFKQNKHNKGFTYNFIDMIFDAGNDYDFYALCDQDDVWLENKLDEAIKKIKESNKHKVMYCSNMTLVDEELNVLGYQEKNDIHKNRYSGLISNIATGCTIVMDKDMFLLIKKHYPTNIYLHDYWIYLISEFCGYVIYDTNSYILYRQHNNIIGSNKKITIKRMKNAINPKHPTSLLIEYFYNLYKDDIHENDFKNVSIVANYNKSFKNRLRLIFSGINSRNHKVLHLFQFLFKKF